MQFRLKLLTLLNVKQDMKSVWYIKPGIASVVILPWLSSTDICSFGTETICETSHGFADIGPLWEVHLFLADLYEIVYQEQLQLVDYLNQIPLCYDMGIHLKLNFCNI